VRCAALSKKAGSIVLCWDVNVPAYDLPGNPDDSARRQSGNRIDLFGETDCGGGPGGAAVKRTGERTANRYFTVIAGVGDAEMIYYRVERGPRRTIWSDAYTWRCQAVFFGIVPGIGSQYGGCRER